MNDEEEKHQPAAQYEEEKKQLGMEESKQPSTVAELSAGVQRKVPTGSEARRMNRYCKKYPGVHLITEESSQADSWHN